MPLLDLLGFDDVKVLSQSLEISGSEYPISHSRRNTPLHLMGAKLDLDGRVAGIPGAARLSPHSLLQQFLNRSDDHVWGIVTNGKGLRILRDSVSLTRQAYVEFDLEAMFNGDVFPDFVLLYRIVHASRFEGDRPEDYLLEQWIASAREEGIRALDQLRDGVEAALTELGTGFLSHPSNTHLRKLVEEDELEPRDMYRYLLRLVYRLLFLFVAEDRDLLLVPETTPDARDRYDRYYSSARIRDLAARPVTPGHTDLWAGIGVLMRILGRDEGEPALGLPGLGSFLWDSDAIGPLIDSDIDNGPLLEAVRSLAYVQEEGTVRRIDFAALGAEELGSVYESLLELHPVIDKKEGSFALGEGAGSERKTTGTYYTPTSLISELLDSALDPVLEESAQKEDPEKAILDLKVIDPAAGSGHFLVAAAHRIAKRLAEVRTGEPEPPEDEYRKAVREVVSRCLFAVDVNDLAVELCKVSLWLEAIEPGKPLSFLDHHILQGNSLIGATPSAVADGIPDDAFVALTGDDRKVVSDLKKRNKQERRGQAQLAFDSAEMDSIGNELEALERFDDSDLETVRTKEKMLAAWRASSEYEHAKLVADAWCAAFAIEKTSDSPALTEAGLRALQDEASLSSQLAEEIKRLAQRHKFFHWHLAFPQVLTPSEDPDLGPGWTGGFDVVLGNPPWERVKLQEKEFFARRSPEIAQAPNKAARERLIERLPSQAPELWRDFQRALRDADVVSHFLRRSGAYPLCGRGDVNTYTVFAELMQHLASSVGRVGVILPTGIATDFTTREFFNDLISSGRLVSLFGFQNEAKLFPGIDHRVQFCLLTTESDSVGRDSARFAFFLHRVTDLRILGRTYQLTAKDIERINPNTGTAPAFSTIEDATVATGIYRRLPVLSADAGENAWDIDFATMFHMANDSSQFEPYEDVSSEDVGPASRSDWTPLYEAKMMHLFDHRFGTYAGQTDAQRRQYKLPELSDRDKADPTLEPQSRYVMASEQVKEWWNPSPPEWVLGWREITTATVLRTLVCCALPDVAIGHKIQLLRVRAQPKLRLCLLGNLGSFVLDYVARQKIGGSGFSFFVMKQLPVLSPQVFEQPVPWSASHRLADWIAQRVFELTYTSWALSSVASDMQSPGGPFRWNAERRFQIRAELDAAFFVLYGLDRTDVDYVLDTFRVYAQRDTATFGSFVTKEAILRDYDLMTTAMSSGSEFTSQVQPEPADPSLRAEAGSST